MKLRQVTILLGFVLGIFFTACDSLVPPPTPTPTALPTETATLLPTAEILPALTLDFISPKSGATFQPNALIACNGTYSLPIGVDATKVYVWILLKDGFGNYYLQNPPITLNTGGTTWDMSNVHVGSGITNILAVQVTLEGNQFFRDKVNNKQFGAFVDLPEGSKIVASANISTS